MRSLHETTSALEKAIDANLGIQAELVAKLKQISEAKQKNRLQCVKIKGALDRHLKLKFNEELGNTEIATAGKITVKGYLNKLWNDNDNMKWKRRFFVDPEKSTPEPNDDEIQRRIWEGDLASGAFVHRFVPWSKIEIVTMVECAEEVREKQRKAQDEGDEKPIKDTDINFHEVAERIKDKLCSKTFTPSQMTRHTYSLTDGTVKNKHIPRSWVDYRIKFVCSASPSINNRPFTKAESLKVIEYLHSHDGNPPWHLVAKTLGTSRTPFQCFQHAQTKLSNTLREMGNPIIFLQDDDELLFKFIAASGPQFVINNNTATLMAQKIFPHVSHFQIIHRAHNSLINPQFVNEKWSESEERALVMGMKVYDESDNTPAKAAVGSICALYSISIFTYFENFKHAFPNLMLRFGSKCDRHFWMVDLPS